MSTITEQLDEINNILQSLEYTVENRKITENDWQAGVWFKITDEARTRLQALMLRERLDELTWRNPIPIDPDTSEWGEGYNDHARHMEQLRQKRIAELTQQLTALEGNTQEGELE